MDVRLTKKKILDEIKRKRSISAEGSMRSSLRKNKIQLKFLNGTDLGGTE